MRLALIAHDEKKPDMIEFAGSRADALGRFELMATGTTGKRLQEATDLNVERNTVGYNYVKIFHTPGCRNTSRDDSRQYKQSGPIGGDMQIGAEIADSNCDGVIFLRDPLIRTVVPNYRSSPGTGSVTIGN